MYGRDRTPYYPGTYQHTRHTAPGRDAPPPGREIQPTRVVQQQQPSPMRNQPHNVGYNQAVDNLGVCRCAHPASHNGAFTPIRNHQAYDGISRRDRNGTRINWEEEAHKSLDALGKDRATEEEIRSVWAQVYDAETVRALEAKHHNMIWSRRRGISRKGIPHDVTWHGRRNPLICRILRAPEDPHAVFVGPQGGYRPGPTASATGTRLEGRATMLGHTWGASQLDRSEPSSRGGRSRR
jgi:hypothetical protein